VAHSWRRATSQYLRVLAGRARIEGVAIDAATTPLVLGGFVHESRLSAEKP
jgi:hypothetical protein